MTQFFKQSVWIHFRRLALLGLVVIAACSGSSTTILRGNGGSGNGTGGSGGGGPVCASGQTQCGAGCADLASDEANCGSCGITCPAATSCVNSSCACQTGLTDCSGTCVDTQSSGANCGACGSACATGTVCSAGQCQSSCATGLTQCGSDCVDFGTSLSNCGGCNQPCASGQTCVGGACQCGAQEQFCGGYCVNVQTDPANCGGCGVNCGANACNSGVCATSGTGGTGTGGTSSGGTTGTGGVPNQPWTVQAGGYVISCNWHGYAWTTAGPTGSASTITPASFSTLAAGGQLCASGSVAAETDYGGYAMLGVQINQASGANTTADPVTPTGSGLIVNVTNTGGSPLRVQIQDALGATDATHRWCATISGSGGTIPWTSFNTTCWNTTGTPYAMQPINAVVIAVPGSNTAATPFNFCLNSISQAGGACGGSGTGGTGGTGTGGAGTGGTSTGGTSTGGTGTGGTTTGGSGGTVNCNGSLPSGGTVHTGNNLSGTAGSLSWSIWTNSGPGSMTTYSVPAFKASWGGSGDFLARMGIEWGNGGAKPYTQLGTITAQFAETKTGDAGLYSYVGIYGWSVSPCVEWYIIDDSYNPMPVNPGSTTNKGTANIDGGTYNVYTRSTNGTGGSRCSASITSWQQYYSIRRTARTCGTISITQHFDAWAAAGMALGNLLEAKVLIETGGGTGNVSFTTANVTAQ